MEVNTTRVYNAGSVFREVFKSDKNYFVSSDFVVYSCDVFKCHQYVLVCYIIYTRCVA